MRQKSWNQFKKTMAASTLAGAITFTGCAVMPSVTAFADTTEQTGQVSYDNEVMPIHTDVKTEAKPLMKGTSCTVSDGKNLYYAFEMMGVRMGIMKYNTKTGKKSEVYSYKIGKNKKGSNGFSQLSVDKKYIYATWDRYYGTDATKEYIYRIAKDGKSAKKLALGRDPQLVDGRIYYLALKSKSEDGMNYSEDTGTVMSMKTDGTDKKKVAQIVNSGDAYRYSLFQSEGKIYYTKENENKTFYDLEGNSYQREAFAVKDENYLSVSLEAVNDGTYTYRTTGKDRYMQTKLYRTDNRTGKKNLVASFKLGIEKYSVCGNYVFVEANVPYKGADVTEKFAVYCYKADGSSKVKLASWFPAE